MRHLILPLVLSLPTGALAVGGGSSTPPTPTETTTTCENGQIYDADTQTCVNPDQARLDDDTRYGAVRELAYAGRYDDALRVIETMDPADDRALTYRGFIARKTGDQPAALAYYRAALEANPDNLLARSYMGQGFAEAGDFDAARVELREIRARGGRETWPEVALRLAIETGTGPAY